jgi:hypothetical protein
VLVESVRASPVPMSLDVEGVLLWLDDAKRADWGDPLLASFTLTPDGSRVASYSLKLGDASTGLGQRVAEFSKPTGRPAVEGWILDFAHPPA